MEAFKYLKRRYLNSTLAGDFQLTRLRYYQLLEIATGDSSVGDSFEGRGVTTVNGDTADPVTGDLFREALRTHRIADGPGRFSFTNFRNIDDIDCFVLCFSSAGPETAAIIDSAYDGCVRVADVELLAERLLSEAVDAESGVPLNTLFDRALCGKVSYTWAEQDFLTTGFATGHPFIKRPEYSHQAEIRLAFRPRLTIERDFIRVQCPTAASLTSAIEVTWTATESNDKKIDYESEIALIRAALQNEQAAFLASGVDLATTDGAKQFVQWQEDFNRRFTRRLAAAIFERRRQKPDSDTDRRITIGASVSAILGGLRISERATSR